MTYDALGFVIPLLILFIVGVWITHIQKIDRRSEGSGKEGDNREV